MVVCLITTTAQINTIYSNKDCIEKYFHPYTNVILNNTGIIPDEIVSATLPLPLEYQQIKANARKIHIATETPMYSSPHI